MPTLTEKSRATLFVMPTGAKTVVEGPTGKAVGVVPTFLFVKLPVPSVTI